MVSAQLLEGWDGPWALMGLEAGVWGNEPKKAFMLGYIPSPFFSVPGIELGILQLGDRWQHL